MKHFWQLRKAENIHYFFLLAIIFIIRSTNIFTLNIQKLIGVKISVHIVKCTIFLWYYKVSCNESFQTFLSHKKCACISCLIVFRELIGGSHHKIVDYWWVNMYKSPYLSLDTTSTQIPVNKTKKTFLVSNAAHSRVRSCSQKGPVQKAALNKYLYCKTINKTVLQTVCLYMLTRIKRL